MPVTYTHIQTTTVSSLTAQVNLSSIPGTYTDLVLVMHMQLEAGVNQSYTTQVRFNDVTSGSYTYCMFQGTQANANSGSAQNNDTAISGVITGAYTSATSSDNFTQAILHILDYANTSNYKTFLISGGTLGGSTNTENRVTGRVGAFRQTGAITKINLLSDASGFKAGSSFSLYGILAA